MLRLVPAPSPPPARCSGARFRARGAGRAGALVTVVLAIGILLGSCLVLGGSGSAVTRTANPSPALSASPPPTSSVRAPSPSPAAPARSPAATAQPSDSTPCRSLNETICVSITNGSVPNIIPGPGSHVSSVEPLPNQTISLWVRSEFSLVWGGNVPTSGPHSPLSLNATGVLWNGVPYYSESDGTVWHPTGNTWWSYGPTGVNKTFPYYYALTFSTRSVAGTANFFPGMVLTWWIYFVQNTSGVYTHWSTVPFQFTFGGAWPASPYPGAAQYGGSGAVEEDLAVSQTPLAPNYNDGVTVTISTTPQDLFTGAAIGGAYVDVTESAPNGAVLNATTISMSLSIEGSVGSPNGTALLPASLAHSPGALITYRITAWDMSQYVPGQVGPDAITTATFNYTVNGNGTFSSGIFANDLALATVPGLPGFNGQSSGYIAAGMPVALELASKSTTTAIEAAEADITFTYPGIGESVALRVPLQRVNSTHFVGSIPALPLGSQVSFEIVAWDFSQDREVSTNYTYATEPLNDFFATIPSNSTFFVVYVYDNSTGRWVTNAQVTITGVVGSGYIRSESQTFGGVTYPNATAGPFVPLLVSAGTSYHIIVNDSAFLPAGETFAPSVDLSLVMPHAPTRTGILMVGSNYVVAESGPSLYFWLNQTYSSLTYSPGTGISTSLLVESGLGLGALALAGIPLYYWWATIRARRAEQERRITL